MLNFSEDAELEVEKEEKMLREHVIQTYYGSVRGLFLKFWVKTLKLLLVL